MSRWGKLYDCNYPCVCESQPQAKSFKFAGVDVGLQTFATLSNGEKIANPRFFKKEQDALAKAQRQMSKHAKGTPERAKRRKVVARIHERIANKRTNFAHQESRKLVNTYGVIVLEKLAVVDMMSNHTQVFGNKRSYPELTSKPQQEPPRGCPRCCLEPTGTVHSLQSAPNGHPCW